MLAPPASASASSPASGDDGARAESAIVGGGKAGARAWDFAVALRLRKLGVFCTGSLVAATKVLTAAHCVKGLEVRKIRVLADSPWAAGGRAGRSLEVRKVRVHPDYNARLTRRDLAVLTLLRPAASDPVGLPSRARAKELTRPGRVMRSAGWGARSPWGFSLSKRLKRTREKALANARCFKAYGKIGYQSGSMLCAIGARVGRFGRTRVHSTTCLGDSGGPLVGSTSGGPVIVGVTSAGPIPCGVGPSIYARVGTELRWIRRQLDPGSQRGAKRTRRAAHSRARILEEIAKCELVCANCHREGTFGNRRGAA
jgi:secreted trypsin-like serine protease